VVGELNGACVRREESWFTNPEDALINAGQYYGPVPDDYEIPLSATGRFGMGSGVTGWATLERVARAVAPADRGTE
jgi:hypothetical protein